MTQCNVKRSEFANHGRREVRASFDGGTMNSDAGALLLRETDRRLRLLERFLPCFRDERSSALVRHRLSEMLAQRVYSIALDYEDLNDQVQLRFDPLLRAKHNRGTNDDLNLFECVRHSPVQSQLCIVVQRQSARPKKSKQKARDKQAQRTAEVALRYRQIELRPAPYHQAKEPIVLWLVHVKQRIHHADQRSPSFAGGSVDPALSALIHLLLRFSTTP